MPNSAPLVSVLLPNFNHARYLAQAIESVRAQTYPHFEILFVDDGSTDDSRAVVTEIVARDPRVKPIFFERNQGAMQALDNAWRRASGELVYGFASDDAIADPEFFRLGVEALARNPTAAGFYGLTSVFSDERGLLGNMGSACREGFNAPAEFVPAFLGGQLFVPGSSSLWRRQLLADVGGFQAELGPQCDYYVNHVLPALHGVVFCPRVFSRMRSFESRKSYSSRVAVEENWQRLLLVESKMRAAVPLCEQHAQDWPVWRRAQLLSLLRQKSSFGLALSRARRWLQERMPGGFAVVDAIGKALSAPLLRIMAAVSPRYRNLTRRAP